MIKEQTLAKAKKNRKLAEKNNKIMTLDDVFEKYPNEWNLEDIEKYFPKGDLI